ncbi:PREDICTED: multidrug resistance-associated protein 4-like [Bison bison bison]|uniref:Multidrug resistance-associated protein 4 n=1 Tax=Bison bison bison TaxID=43346 RepID=A0A6P3GSM7_BISBB|nr:PREDICTED: multidrug resistance-associated protein 4-like [Bison bison bison]
MRKPNPLQDANFCSRLFFCWLNPLFKIGYKRRLEEDDMYSVLLEDRSQHLGEELQGYWDQEVLRAEKDAREPSLMKAILKCHWKSYLVLGIFILLEEGTRVVQPIFLGKMISYVENYDPTDSAALHEAYGYAAGLSASVLVWAVLHHLYFYHIQRLGMRLRVALCHMIYCKVLRLSSSAMGKTTTGQIVNLLSNDVNRFDQVMMFLHYLWVGPLQAIAVTALLWMETGISCLAGMAVLIFLLLLQSCFGMWFSSLQSKTAALTDDRIRTMSEFISGIKSVKMNAWEKSLIDLITRLRRKEISKILQSSYLRGMNLASFFAVTKIMIFVTFITNVALKKVITASQVFVVVTLYEALRFTSTLYFPMAIEKVSEAIISIRRIKNFLLLDEISQLTTQLPSDDKTIVHMKDFTAFWDKESETPTLQGLSFTVRPGELLVVVGPVGAGKSSLLCALLGELPPSQGQASVHGRIVYVSQQPWVFSGTVRSNILFGKKYEEERYEKVIKACALKEDLQLLKENDLTEIGDRGTPLSEGQKARVSLARAVYQDADIYLLDDPLSAVDVGVSGHLFKQYYVEKVLTVGIILFGITKSLLMFYVLVNSSQTLHNKMLESIFRAPMLFFDRNPIGKCLNRYQKNLPHIIDMKASVFLLFQTFLLVIGVVGVMVAAIPWIAIPVIPLGILFFVLWRYFLETSRDVKHLECTTRSPVFSHLASSLRGLWTIRAYKAEQKFQELFDAYQDLHSEAWFLLLTTSRWLAVYLDVICAIFVTLVAFGALILAETLDLGQVGLVLSLSLVLTGMFQWCVRQSAEVENMMMSVERVIEYTDLEKEEPWELEYRPPPFWPTNGRISLFSVNFRYNSDSPLILRNLETSIYSREKYGIVGRTGAGKSSLIAALFRLSEPEGGIYIDGILTAHIGLHDLRKKLSVALQEPVLFTGTMRENLDPFNEHTDNELWNALEEVQLKESIEGLPAKMNTELAESGLNLSAGQKQLVCLARAILRKNQILILDKATSYVDPRCGAEPQEILH